MMIERTERATAHQVSALRAAEMHPSDDCVFWAGEVSPPATATEIASAVRAVVARHEALRTTLRRVGDGVVQDVWTPGDGDLLVTGLEPEQMAADLCRPFDLVTELPARFGLAATSGRQILAFCVHHAFFDGWSVSVVLRDLEAALAGRELPSSRDTLQLSDFGRWQRAIAASADVTPWRGHLRGASSRAREGWGTEPGDLSLVSYRHTVMPTGVSAQRLRASAQRLGVEPVALLVAAGCMATAEALPRRAVVGVMHANRRHPDLAETVGFLADRMPIVVDLGDEPDVRSLAMSASSGLAFAAEHFAPTEALLPLLDNPDYGPGYCVCINHLRSPRLLGRERRIRHARWLNPYSSDVVVPRGWIDVIGQIGFESEESPKGTIRSLVDVDSGSVPAGAVEEFAVRHGEALLAACELADVPPAAAL